MVTQQLPTWLRADENGGSPALPAALDAALAMHQRLAREPNCWQQQLVQLRQACAELLESTASGLWFTSSGSHANALAITAYAAANPGLCFLHSGLEHPATLAVLQQVAKRYQIQLARLPCKADGTLCLAALRAGLAQRPAAVVALWASNETGVIQPLEQVLALCRAARVPLLCDGVQAIGRLPWPRAALWPDALSCVGHKLGGIGGCGLLRLQQPWLHKSPWPWGDQGAEQLPWSSAEVNLPAAAALVVALQAAKDRVDDWPAVLQAKLAFEQRLQQSLPGVTILGQTSPRLPQTSTIHLAGCPSDALLMVLDVHAGIACSAGSACRSGIIEPSPSLLHMGLTAQAAQQVVRFSWGGDAATCVAQMESLYTALLQWVPKCRV